MTALAPLVPVAVVGTARRELDAAVLAACPALTDLPPARALLAAAARAAVMDRVSLPTGAPVDDPGPDPETLPAPESPFYSGTLQQAIGGQRWRAVTESLRHLAATRQRLPVGALAGLLQEAETRRELRRDLQPVLGARGRWLVSRNPRWSFDEWVTPDTADEELWVTAAPAARVAWLRAVRASDPARARTLLEQRPPADASVRADCLNLLRDGLGPADEPLLEAALDDRARNVRAVARDLLASLPHSAFVARMRVRIQTRVTVRQGRWSVDFSHLGPQDARDGLSVDARERPPGAAAVRALTGGVPLRDWGDHLVPPVELLRVRADPMELGPMPGLRDAAVRERDGALAREILLDRRWPGDPELVAVLDPRDVDDVLARRVRVHEPLELIGEFRVRGFGPETAGALLGWLGESRNHGRRAAILGVLGDHGPLETDRGDLATALRRLAGALLSADRSRALDAAMTINLRRSLRAEATPTLAQQSHPDQEQP